MRLTCTMNPIFIFAVAAALGIFSPCQAFNCTGRADGPYEAGCQSLTKCVDNEAIVLECHKPQVVNEKKLICDHALNVSTPCGLFRDCSYRDDGSYPEVGFQCQWYYTCIYEIFYGHHKCVNGLVWNTVLQTCDYHYNVLPPCGTKKAG